MEILILFAILALLILGPRRGGRWPSAIALVLGAVLLVWLGAAFGLGAIWNAIVGNVAQP